MRGQSTPRCLRIRSRQRGQALIMVLVLIGIIVSALVFSLAGRGKIEIEVNNATAAALAQAKDALIGYAASDTNRPGSLPCPDADNNGNAEPFSGADCPGYIAGSNVYMGRLPWKTLGLPEPRDGSGERLWYAVSRVFARNPSCGAACPLNTDTTGQLTVTGTPSYTNAIAIVFAAGPTLGAQLRDPANENAVANYLEGENANGDSVFAIADVTATFNDRLFVITSDILFPAVQFRVGREARTFLGAYFNANGYYPFANPYTDPSYDCNLLTYRGRIPNTGGGLLLSPCGLVEWGGAAVPPPWFTPNNWHQVVFYAVAPACTTTLSLFICANVGGFLTVNGVTNIRAVVIVTGRGLGGQIRPCATVSNCLEDPENIDADNTYADNPVTATINDRLVIVAP